jgi:predicted kinase
MKALIIITGMIGTGKTTVANALAKKLNMEVISSDPVRKELAGINPYERKRNDFGQGIYSEEISDKVYSIITQMARSLLIQGKGVVLDATFSKERWRREAISMAKELGIPFILVLVTAPPEIVRERLKAREKQRVVSDGRWEIYLKHQKGFQVPREGGPLVILDTRENLNSLVKRVEEVLNGL